MEKSRWRSNWGGSGGIFRKDISIYIQIGGACANYTFFFLLKHSFSTADFLSLMLISYDIFHVSCCLDTILLLFI